MADRYRGSQRGQYERDYDRRDHDRHYNRQPEQFHRDEQIQYGDTWGSGERYERQDRFEGRYGSGPEERSRQYAQRSFGEGAAAHRDDHDPLDDYDMQPRGRPGYGARQTHSFFRNDDYGGANLTGANYGAGATRPSRMGGYSSPNYDRSGYGDGRFGRMGGQGYDRDSGERGFFDKAGDTIASWFGDEEAERRLERDHRGSGPSNYQRSDERLLEDACERLTHDPYVDARNINVTASDNEITLEGTVDSRMAKRRAEDCVHDISGVKHVQNNLRIEDNDDWSSGSSIDRTSTSKTGKS